VLAVFPGEMQNSTPEVRKRKIEGRYWCDGATNPFETTRLMMSTGV